MCIRDSHIIYQSKVHTLSLSLSLSPPPACACEAGSSTSALGSATTASATGAVSLVGWTDDCRAAASSRRKQSEPTQTPPLASARQPAP
eukprot:3143317-Prymnesium_polylepis.1